MLYNKTGMCFGTEFWDLKLTAGGRLLHYLGGSGGSSPRIKLYWFIFIPILDGRYLGPLMIH